MFEKLEDLAKNNKKISDFHIRAGSPLAYRATGEIIKVNEVMVTPQDLKDLLSMNCNEEELEKFERTHELDTAVNLSGLRFRANFYKTINGPACVCRRVESKIPDMDQFNLPQALYDIIDFHKGLVLVTGPTGSGKSTTLAAALKEKDTGDTNIVTAEDPIEYDMGGDINQVQVNRAKGQTFATILRTFLRQDPDVILIGETRDPETAESSMDAAETGHLVFTTLHANSSTSSLTRLLDMEVPKYKLNASVRGVLAQRLLRKVCTGCAIKRPISESEAIEFNIKKNTPIMYANSLSSEEKLNRKKENTLCQKCQGSGYKGRVGTYELLLIDRKVQNAISKGLTDKEVEQLAVNENSMLTLSQYGVELVKENLTTISEVIRVCKSD